MTVTVTVTKTLTVIRRCVAFFDSFDHFTMHNVALVALAFGGAIHSECTFAAASLLASNFH